MSEEGAVGREPDEADEWRALRSPPIGLGATFADPELEGRFRAWALAADQRHARAAMSVASALTLAFAVSDVVFFGLGALTARLFALRLALALPGFAWARAIPGVADPRRVDRIVHAWTACVGAMVVYLAASRPPGQPLPVLTLAVAIIAVHGFMPTRFFGASATTAAMTAAYLSVLAARAGTTLTQFTPIAISLTLANAVGLVVSRAQHRARRARYVEFLVERRITARLREELETRRRVERSLRDAEANLNAAFEAVPFPLAIVGAEHGRVLRRNAALRQLEGSPEQSSPELAAFLAAHPELLAADAERPAVAEGVFVDAQGAPLHVVASARRIDFFGEPSALLSFVDITARKQTEDALASAKEQAEEASRAKTLFVATASHELRTPLHGIMSAAQLLGSTALRDDQRHWLELLRTSGDVLRRLVDDILDLSRAQSGDLALVASRFLPRALLAEVCALARARADASRVSLRVAVDDDAPPALIGDAGRLRQVLSNLVENALKYGAGADVELCVRTVELSPARAALRFEVSDRGPGVPEAAQRAIFEPFVQIEPKGTRRDGIGLGLAIGHRIVAAMGGALVVCPREGGGSCFSFTITFAIAASDEPGPTRRRPRRAAPARALDVLLVDDDEIARRLGREILVREGHHVTVAASGDEALERLASGAFDVALLDVRMSGVSGVDVAVRARRLGPPARAFVPLVATTANARPEERASYLAAGFDRVLAKPLDFDEVASTLAELTAGHTTSKSAPRPDDGAHLDEALLARHGDAMGAAWVNDLLGRALSVVPSTLGELRDAHERGDRRRVRDVAHRLAGAAETAGLARVAKAAARLEDAASVDGAGLGDLVAALDTETSASLAELRRRLEHAAAVSDSTAAHA